MGRDEITGLQWKTRELRNHLSEHVQALGRIIAALDLEDKHHYSIENACDSAVEKIKTLKSGILDPFSILRLYNTKIEQISVMDDGTSVTVHVYIFGTDKRVKIIFEKDRAWPRCYRETE